MRFRTTHIAKNILVLFALMLSLGSCQDLAEVLVVEDGGQSAPTDSGQQGQEQTSTALGSWDSYKTNVHPLSDKTKISYVNVPYGDEQRQKLDVFLPQGNGPFPTIIFIHGGGFVAGNKDAQYKGRFFKEFQAYLDAGIAVANVGYRLLDKRGEEEGVKKSISDGQRALAMLFEEGEALGLDVDNFILRGSSAGASICLWVGMEDGGVYFDSGAPLPSTFGEFKGIVATNTQGTLDLVEWERVFEDYDFDMKDMMGEDFIGRAHGFYGMPEKYTWNRDAYISASQSYRTELGTKEIMDSGDPILYVFNKPELSGVPKAKNLLFHHKHHARYLERLSANIGGEFHQRNIFIYEEDLNQMQLVGYVKGIVDL